jgi:hypothetical protein
MSRKTRIKEKATASLPQRSGNDCSVLASLNPFETLDTESQQENNTINNGNVDNESIHENKYASATFDAPTQVLTPTKLVDPITAIQIQEIIVQAFNSQKNDFITRFRSEINNVLDIKLKDFKSVHMIRENQPSNLIIANNRANVTQVNMATINTVTNESSSMSANIHNLGNSYPNNEQTNGSSSNKNLGSHYALSPSGVMNIMATGQIPLPNNTDGVTLNFRDQPPNIQKAEPNLNSGFYPEKTPKGEFYATATKSVPENNSPGKVKLTFRAQSPLLESPGNISKYARENNLKGNKINLATCGNIPTVGNSISTYEGKLYPNTESKYQNTYVYGKLSDANSSNQNNIKSNNIKLNIIKSKLTTSHNIDKIHSISQSAIYANHSTIYNEFTIIHNIPNLINKLRFKFNSECEKLQLQYIHRQRKIH